MGQILSSPARLLFSLLFFSPGPAHLSSPLAQRRLTQLPPFLSSWPARSPSTCKPNYAPPPCSHVIVAVAMPLLTSTSSLPRPCAANPLSSASRHRCNAHALHCRIVSPYRSSSHGAHPSLQHRDNFSHLASPFLSLTETHTGSASSPPSFSPSSSSLSHTQEEEQSRGA